MIIGLGGVRMQAETETHIYEERQKSGEILNAHPALLRLEELQALRDLAKNANARIYIGFDKQWSPTTSHPE